MKNSQTAIYRYIGTGKFNGKTLPVAFIGGSYYVLNGKVHPEDEPGRDLEKHYYFHFNRCRQIIISRSPRYSLSKETYSVSLASFGILMRPAFVYELWLNDASGYADSLIMAKCAGSDEQELAEAAALKYNEKYSQKRKEIA